MRAELHDWREWPKLAGAWAGLVERCPHATFFVSPPWVETWLDAFAARLDPQIVLFRDDGEVIGACLLARSVVRKGPFTLRRLSLNTAGEPDEDSPCVEFNTLLCEGGCERAVAAELHRLLVARGREPWDQLAVDGIADEASLTALREAFAPLACEDRVRPSYYLDLEQLRREGGDFLASFRSSRYRQSVKKYAELGELRLEAARSVGEAQAMLEELAALHQRAWTGRGYPGSFASGVFFDFHRALVRRCFDADQVQLLRLCAGDATLGAIYNFVYRGKLYFYQSGFDYSHGSRLSPGIVTHALAIQHASALGLSEYDLLAGDADYKKKLASQSRELHWLSWQAPSAKMKAFDMLRRMKQGLAAVASSQSRDRAESSSG